MAEVTAVDVRGVPTEFSFHPCPPRMARELPGVFGDALKPGADVVVVAIYQKAKMDLVAIGVDVDVEKDRLLEQFNEITRAACAELQGHGHWADFTDPCSGYPALGDRHKSIFPDVLGAQSLLKYETGNAGCCQVLSHPSWGTKIYPAHMFSDAPMEAVQLAVRAAVEAAAVAGDGAAGLPS